MLEKFVQECLVRTEPFVKIPAKVVYESFLAFCKHNGIITHVSNRKFYKELEKLGVIRGKYGFYWGWHLKKCKF